MSFSTWLGNYILDLDDESLTPIPGGYDAVPSEEDLMIVPRGRFMAFYPMKELYEKGNYTRAIEKDEDADGNYQSVATLERQGNGRKVRLYRPFGAFDYHVTNVNGSVSVTALGEVKEFCPDLYLRLPMLSKDGTEIAGVDPYTGTTKVFEFHEKAGVCVEQLDLGVATGKVNFSYDGKKLAFHVQGEQPEGDWIIPRPDEGQTINSYVYDRETRRLTPLTHNRGESSYYPGFRRNGNIVYVHQDNDGDFSFRELDPGLAKAYDISAFDKCDDETRQAQFAIGRLLADVCDMSRWLTEAASRLLRFTLDKDKCQKLVDENWPERKADILNDVDTQKYSGWFVQAWTGVNSDDRLEGVEIETLKDFAKEDLLAACSKPVVSSKPAKPKPAPISPPPAEMTGQEIAQRRCAVCHTEMNTSRQPASAGHRSFLKKATAKVQSGEMPPGGGLDRVQKEKLLKYLKQ